METRDSVDLVVEDLIERKKLGTERYGVPLNANSEKDMLIEAYEEILDLCIYLRTELDKRKNAE